MTAFLNRTSCGPEIAAFTQTLLTAPAQPGPLLATALGWLCAATQADFGALLVLNGDTLAAAAVCEHGAAAAAAPERLELLLTQGIAGYAAARAAPILLRDIGADPRWGPPGLDPTLPVAGAALAVPACEPVQAVLVLRAAQASSFTAEKVAWLGYALELLCEPVRAALA